MERRGDLDAAREMYETAEAVVRGNNAYVWQVGARFRKLHVYSLPFLPFSKGLFSLFRGRGSQGPEQVIVWSNEECGEA